MSSTQPRQGVTTVRRGSAANGRRSSADLAGFLPEDFFPAALQKRAPPLLDAPFEYVGTMENTRNRESAPPHNAAMQYASRMNGSPAPYSPTRQRQSDSQRPPSCELREHRSSDGSVSVRAEVLHEDYPFRTGLLPGGSCI
jgi:hypothetical protein